MTQTTFGTRLLISRKDIATTGLDMSDVPDTDDLAPGQILFRVDQVALTANNITYAAAGDAFGYWNFFPGPDGFGIVPVWGFANVVASRADGIKEGERFYGYWPLATHLVCNSADISSAGFSDPSAHRQALGPFYNRYLRTAADPGYTAESENLQCLFRPLFTTAFLIEGFLGSADFFGAEQIIISSASSKTAFALAFLLNANRKEGMKIVGMTSPANKSFVEKLGSYDVVLGYGEPEKLAKVPSVYIDFAGSRDTTMAVHQHLGDALKHSATIGMTHIPDLTVPPEPLPGPQPVLFFAPTVAEAQVKALGPAGFAKALSTAWMGFTPHANSMLSVREVAGMAAAQVQYTDLVAGKIAPADALVLKLGG